MSVQGDLTNADDRFAGVLRAPQVVHEALRDDGLYPNNERLPLLIGGCFYQLSIFNQNQ